MVIGLRVLTSPAVCSHVGRAPCAGGKKLHRELSIEEGLDVGALSPQDITAHLRTLLQTARVKYAHTPHPAAWPLELMLKFCADSRPLSRPPRLCAPRMVFFSFLCAQRRRAGRVAVSPVRWLSDGRHLPRVASGTATKRRPIARPQAGAQRGEAALECAGGKQG